MPKVTLDLDTFKALASDTRLDILRVLDGKKMNLKDISKATNLNKATLHEHLAKLNEAGLIKRKERDGHKWVYYKLTWKGEGLLHPENTRIVILFSTTFITLFFGIIQFVNFVRGRVVGLANTFAGSDSTYIYATEESGLDLFAQTPPQFNYVSQVPLENQTTKVLSTVLNENAEIKGVLGNTIQDSDIQWTAVNEITEQSRHYMSEAVNDVVSDGAAGSTVGSGVPSMVAVIQDPALLQIAIVCMIIFSILITISIWRFWKNKTPKI